MLSVHAVMTISKGINNPESVRTMFLGFIIIVALMGLFVVRENGLK